MYLIICTKCITCSLSYVNQMYDSFITCTNYMYITLYNGIIAVRRRKNTIYLTMNCNMVLLDYLNIL